MNRKPLKSAGDPSDLDLMLYADGELEGEARAAVEAYLAKVAAGSTKVAQLNLASSILREQALDAAGKADGIADAVMAKIAAGGAVAKETPALKLASLASKPAPSRRATRRERSANDNARAIFALAAVAVAAAAGLMIWGRMDAAPQHAPIAISTTSPQSPALPSSAAPASEGDNEPGVEVAAVDFGARMGTIFYVPTKESTSNGTTTVVWLNDDDDDSSGEE
jgi:hypothetical protein